MRYGGLIPGGMTLCLTPAYFSRADGSNARHSPPNPCRTFQLERSGHSHYLLSFYILYFFLVLRRLLPVRRHLAVLGVVLHINGHLVAHERQQREKVPGGLGVLEPSI